VTWTKLSDDFGDDCWTLSDAAWRLHGEGLVWSNRKLLDGRLDKDDMRRWAKRPEAVDELLAAGWWTDDGDAYVIVHHAGYQRRREEVLARLERNWKNGQKGGRPKGPPREQAPRKRPQETHSLTQTETQVGSDDNENGNRVANPVANPQGQDRTGLDKRGASLSAEAEQRGDANGQQVCADCGERPAAGLGWDPTLCRRCFDDRVVDCATEDAP
jgi:hypothetical protein